jgi:hypothetical protein
MRSICTVVSIVASMLICSLDARGGSWHAIVLRGRIGTHTATSSCSHIKYVNLHLPLRARVLTFVTQPSSNPSILTFCSTTPSRRNKLLPLARFTHDTALPPLIVGEIGRIPAPCAPIVHRRPLSISRHTPSPATTAKVAISCAHTFLLLVCTCNLWTPSSRHSV